MAGAMRRKLPGERQWESTLTTQDKHPRNFVGLFPLRCKRVSPRDPGFLVGLMLLPAMCSPVLWPVTTYWWLLPCTLSAVMSKSHTINVLEAS